MKTVNHWIGGKTVEGATGLRPGLQPRHRRSGHPGRPGLRGRGRRGRGRGQGGVPLLGHACPCPSAPRSSNKYRELLDAHRDEIAELITAEHGKVHSDALGEVARGLEIVELACGIAEKLKGELSTQVSTGVDAVLDPPAARGGRGHHAVQLPGDGADVDVPGGHRLR
ncbi:Malonate-semialdehyde dehydrogenase [Streptomyces antimycoticus]